MPRIPILPDVRFRDALPEHRKVATRLRRHLLALREPPAEEGSDGTERAEWEDDGERGQKLDAGPDHRWSSRAPLLTNGDEVRIARRARRHVERAAAATGLAHLDRE